MATTELIRPPSHQAYSATHAAPSPPDASRPVLLGDGIAVSQLRSQIQRIAPYYRIAVVRGEAGTGKCVVARAIHAHSAAALGAFVAADAGTFADQLGDAPQPRRTPSLLESAEGGTLYLQRADELTAVQQESLMRFLRSQWERRGSESSAGRRGQDRRQQNAARARSCGMRILVASDRDLRSMAAVGKFRQDLYAQISAVEIVVPPLRERLDDIPVLATWLLRWIEEQAGQSSRHFSQEALAYLRERRWPRNLRELEEVVAQAAATTVGSRIELAGLQALGEAATMHPSPAVPTRIETLNEVVQRHVIEVLMRCGGNKLRAAELLGISRSTLYRMLDANVDGMSVLHV